MNAILKIKDAPKKGLIPGLATLALVAVGGPLISLSLALGSGPDDGSNTSQAALRNADQVTELSIDGRLHLPQMMAMTFEAGGTVGEVLVRQGDKVEKGQVLAKLDAIGLSDLEKAMIAGAIGVITAQEELDALAVSSPVDLALAQAAAAEVAMDDARDDLTNHFNQEDVDLARAQKLVADARLALDDAEDSLADVGTDHSQKLSKAQQDRAAAKVDWDLAQDALADLSLSHAQTLSQAMQLSSAAKIALDDSQESLAEYLLDHHLELAKARQSNAKAGIGLDEAKDALAKFDLDQAEELAAARVASAKAKAELEEATRDLSNFDRARLQNLADARQATAKAEVAVADA